MVEWITSTGLTDFREAEAWMEARVADIHAGEADECIWLVEHPALYTAGTSAKVADLTDPDRFPVYDTKRGGQYTYHGPGQRVAYTLLDVGKRGHDVRLFVQQLEAWVITALSEFNVTGAIRDGRVGVWVDRPDKPLMASGNIAEDKIAAIGIRCANGSVFTASRLMLNRTWHTLTGLFRVALKNTGSRHWWTLACPSAWMM